MRTIIRTLSAFLGLLALPAVLPSATWAAPPTHTSQSAYFSVVLPGDVNGCGFDITATQQGIADLTTYTDAAGNPTRLLIRTPQGTTTFSANGIIYVSPTPAAAHLDFAAGTATFTGLAAHIVVAGQGVVGAQTGKSVYDLSISNLIEAHGQTTLEFPGPFAPSVCAYFTP